MAGQWHTKLEAQIERLVALPPDEMDQEIEANRKFHSLEIARRLIGRSAALQTAAPERANRIAQAALLVLMKRKIDTRSLPLFRSAFDLSGNAARLHRDLDMAETAFSMTFPLPVTEPGEHLRGLALVRWEQSRCEEAIGLLSRAAALFQREGRGAEVTATLQILVLLHAELRDDDTALDLFVDLKRCVEAGSRPWLTARAALTAAFCLAARADAKQSPEAAITALSQGRSLVSKVADEAERLHLEWLAARALARLGKDPAAESALEALREPFLATHPWLDTVLLTLDLLAFRATSRSEIVQDFHDLAGQLHRHSPSAQEADTTVSAIALVQEIAGPGSPWDMVSVIGGMARRLFRIQKLPVRPIPFALGTEDLP